MDSQFWLEVLGYAASVLVAVSLTMKAIVRLRIINLIGAALFSLYGLLIGALPVAAMNAFIVLINMYFLIQLRNTRESFKWMEARPDDPYVTYLMDFYAADIRSNQPGFDWKWESSAKVLLVMRDATPAGIIIGTVHESTFEIALDYVPPKYRDFKIGRFLFDEQSGFFESIGCSVLRAKPATGEHGTYLKTLGFVPSANGMLERSVGKKTS